jgi:uncharacterized protein (DUF697 family)/tellurite resistance protein
MISTPLQPSPRPTGVSASLPAAEQEALLTLCLMAAFADGGKSDAERTEFKRIVEQLATPGLDTLKLYHDVLMKHASVERSARVLSSPETRQLAYEMAVCVCDADDTLSVAEQEFLAGLRRTLGLDTARAAQFEEQACALVVASVPPPLPPAVAKAAAAPPVLETDDDAAGGTDSMILNYAILNGALELLPESLATMAIVPMQMKMVYRIGRSHGYELDRRHITELLGAAGIGLSSQVVEGYARKLLGGLLGRLGAGGTVRQVGNQVASSALTFATTYALGTMAARYYAGGRTLSGGQLRELFQALLGQARTLHGQHAGAIQAKAQNLNPAQLLNLVRGR